MKTMIESQTFPAKDITAPLSVILRDKGDGEHMRFIVHYHNHQDGGFHDGGYHKHLADAALDYDFRLNRLKRDHGIDVEREPLMRYLCEKFKERVQHLGLKGKKRDDELIAYMVGASQSLLLTGRKDEGGHVGLITSMALSTRGYAEVERILKGTS